MFKLNLKIALRNIWKHKFTTSIKLFGLVIGLGTVVLLVAYVMFELSFDRYHQNANQIYRLQSIDVKSLKEEIYLPSGLAKMLSTELPEVSKTTQLRTNKIQLKVGQSFYNENLLTTEKAFFEIFTAPLIEGNSETVLEAPNTVVISASFAKKAFPKGNAIGQVIQIRDYPQPSQIVGVMKDIPAASHFHADIVIGSDLNHKLDWNSYTGIPQYMAIKEGTSAAEIEKKIKTLYTKYDFRKNIEIKLIPLTKIHLYSHLAEELEPNGDVKYIYIFSIVAFFILFIAIANFVNLTVAASLKRGKEIGVKKVMGASIAQLRLQFLSESYLYFLFATFLVLILTYDLIPLIGSAIDISITLSDMVNLKTILISIGVIIGSGFIAGFYPAVILAKLMPVKTLKGYNYHESSNFGFKKVLMVFQFAISAFLIVGTLVIYAQLQFIKNKNLGFNKDQVLVSSFNIYDKSFNSFKEELLRQNGIKSVSLSSLEPGKSFGASTGWTNKNDTTKYEFDFIDADIDFIKTLDIKIINGRAFSALFGSDIFDYSKATENLSKEEASKIVDQTPIILNEAAVKILGISNPIDTIVNYTGVQGKVIGVVNNFNGMSLHNKVTPLVMLLDKNKTAGYLYIKIKGKDVSQAKAVIANVFKKYFPDRESDVQFVDEHLQKLYLAEMRLGSVFISFAAIAIFLCCIGLFGMVYFDLQQRTKEIAVRKVLGASVKDLLTLLNSSFVKIILLANVIIWPIAYYLIKEWLNGFYYRIEMPYTPFIIALLLCLVLTILTVSLQAIKTIKKPPVEALKYE